MGLVAGEGHIDAGEAGNDGRIQPGRVRVDGREFLDQLVVDLGQSTDVCFPGVLVGNGRWRGPIFFR